jgi:kumamolisin
MVIRRVLPALFSCAILLLGGSAASGQAANQAGFLHSFFTTAQQFSTAYEPSEIATAYDFAPLLNKGIDGTGQTAALIEVDGFSRTDIRRFDDQYGLQDPVIREFYVGGHTFTPQHGGETTLDIEWLHALAPGATILVYYLNNLQSESAGWHAMASALHMAADNGAGMISISLGACGPSAGSSVTQSAFSDLFRLGVSVFVSSGDSGAHPGPTQDCGKKIAVAYPSGDPSVVSVGGTSLQLNGDDTIAAEAAWRLSGGGVIKKLSRPLWQIAPQLHHDPYRWAPDVAFLGDPGTGVSIYYRGNWRQAGGTSLGAPAWAAAWALIRESAQQNGKSLLSAPPLLYRLGNSASYGQVFHDIVTGGNKHYHAGPGWDPITGWGTPDVAALSTALQTVAVLQTVAARS